MSTRVCRAHCQGRPSKPAQISGPLWHPEMLCILHLSPCHFFTERQCFYRQRFPCFCTVQLCEMVSLIWCWHQLLVSEYNRCSTVLTAVLLTVSSPEESASCSENPDALTTHISAPNEEGQGWFLPLRGQLTMFEDILVATAKRGRCLWDLPVRSQGYHSTSCDAEDGL